MKRNSDTVGSAKLAKQEMVSGRPDVIVEFLFDRGCLHIAVRNIGDRPAVGVSIKFSQKFTGVGGAKQISAQALFRNIEFLGPGREIKTFIDTSDSYFRRKQPTKISARIAYRDTADLKYESTVMHDLEIYRDLLFLTGGEHECANTDMSDRRAD